MNRTLRGKVAVAGVGETGYFKRGESPDPEFKLALKAIMKACENAGIPPRAVDGFASYSNDRSDPSRLAAALGCKELKFANMQWGGGGGGGSGAIANAAAAIAGGLADCVVVFRALAQGQFGRYGQGARRERVIESKLHGALVQPALTGARALQAPPIFCHPLRFANRRQGHDRRHTSCGSRRARL